VHLSVTFGIHGSRMEKPSLCGFVSFVFFEVIIFGDLLFWTGVPLLSYFLDDANKCALETEVAIVRLYSNAVLFS
jgi:hypothetical protein